jgi:AcrR family transcriptional regulator
MNDTNTETESRPGLPIPQKPASGQNPASTREIILDTAEHLFAENGVAATSIRDITGAAGVNLGAINYHFGTKQELVAAVFSRRLEPVCERQLALMKSVLREAGDKPPSIEAVLEAMIRPTVDKSFAAGKRDLAFMRLVERSISEPNSEVRRLIRTQMQKTIAFSLKSLALALPSLPMGELVWRMMFTMGALRSMLQKVAQDDLLPPEMRKGLNAETMIRRLVTFAAAGMRAEI